MTFRDYSVSKNDRYTCHNLIFFCVFCWCCLVDAFRFSFSTNEQ